MSTSAAKRDAPFEKKPSVMKKIKTQFYNKDPLTPGTEIIDKLVDE